MAIVVNDLHSRLNRTEMVRVLCPTSVSDLQRTLREGAGPFSICGARHAMGAQQFLPGATLIDTSKLVQLRSFDPVNGTITVEAGMTWPMLQATYETLQRGTGGIRWGYTQKQTGADDLTLGGAVAANIHGRGLTLRPFVQDVLELEVVLASGDLTRCSRTLNRELFRLVIGGYGMFGVVTALTLQLTERVALCRSVRVIDIEDAIPAAQRRIAEGYRYGDFQFDIDPTSPDFLTKGVFSGYYPITDCIPPDEQRELAADDWRELLYLAHVDKRQAFQRYAQYYLSTDGQLYWSDTHQRSTYLVDYHTDLDTRLRSSCPGSEMISELYVPPERLVDFLHAASSFLVQQKTPVIYGTIRLIAPDDETFLPWARQRFACIIFNLHVDHSAPGLAQVRDSFRGLIDLALDRGGSFFLTYHRFARPDQLLKAYPMISDFVKQKLIYDPTRKLLSTWFRWIESSVKGGEPSAPHEVSHRSW